MDVRAWCKATAHSVLMKKKWTEEPSEAVADAFAPTITKLVQALRAWEHWYSEDSTEFNRDTAREMGVNALAELEKP